MIMKKIIALAAIMLLGITANSLYAQETKAERKAKRDAERARIKAEERAEALVSFEEALAALKSNQFVLEADQVVFRNGQTAFVNTTTNFVLVNNDRGTVQVAFNTSLPGPNGIGGVTVDGTVSGIEMKTDKQGNINYNFSIVGIGVSAQIFLTLYKDNSNASVDISPNFNNNNMTLSGTVVPLEQSSIFKGRAW